MIYSFILPDPGEGIHESEILSWAVKPGDKIKEDDILVEIQSDKAAIELPSPVSGTVVKLLVAEGEIAKVGSAIVEIEIEEADSKPSPKESAENNIVKHTEDTVVIEHKDVEHLTPSTVDAVSADHSSQKKAVSSADVRMLAIPAVRKYAREKNIDLTKVTGTGRNNRITREDIDNFIATGGMQSVQHVEEQKIHQPEPSKPVEPVKKSIPHGQLETREKMTSTRKAISKAMVNSKATSPHVTVLDKVNVTKLVEHRDRFKVIAKEKGIKLTYTAYFVKAVAAILAKYPDLNASIDEKTEEIVYKHYFNIGIATNTERGLLVPNIKDADRKSLFKIAKDLAENSEKAMNGKLSGEDMRNGSMTITNIGSIATSGVWSTPIINQPEVAILGVARIEDEVIPDSNKRPIVAPMLKISFAFDHRIVDGATAQMAINDLKEYLADPDLLFVEG